jgi:hypothetical protein
MIYSRLALSGAILYLIAFVCAAAYAHLDHRTFSGVFAVLLALPWIDYFASMSLSLAAALNALIIYVVLAALSYLPAWLRRPRG